MERFADEIDLAQFRADQLTELAVAEIRKRSEAGASSASTAAVGYRTSAYGMCTMPPAVPPVRAVRRRSGDG